MTSPGDTHAYQPYVVAVNAGRQRGRTSFRLPDVAYFAVTRFNLFWPRLTGANYASMQGRHIPGSEQYDEYWLNRGSLFRRHCLPTMVNQRIRPHRWFIGFDPEIPPYIQELLDELKEHSFIQPFFSERGDFWQRRDVPQLIRETAAGLNKPFVCTMRFDSDDSIHPVFISSLDLAVKATRDRAIESDRLAISFPYGLSRISDRFQVRMSVHNQFLSVLEDSANARGPFTNGHNFQKHYMPIVEAITRFPVWMYHIHEDSISGFREFPETLDVANPEKVVREFGFAPDPAGAGSDGHGIASQSNLNLNSWTAEADQPFPIRVMKATVRGSPGRESFRQSDVAYALVTRFNLYWSDLEQRKHLERRHLPGSPEYESYWRQRISLFREFCMPSILNLRPRPHGWFILFDCEVTPDIQGLIDELRVHEWIRPLLVERTGGWLWTETQVAPALELLAAEQNASLVCSTRFDSDDSLDRRFYDVVEQVIVARRAVDSPKPPWCLNPTFGLIESASGLTVSLDSATQFASMVESVGSIKGPYQGNHHKIHQVMPLMEILTTRPMWIYRRHNEGIARARQNPPSSSSIGDQELVLRDFGLLPRSAPLEEVTATSTFEPRVDANDEEAQLDDDPIAGLLQAEHALWRNDEDLQLLSERDSIRDRLFSELDFDEQFALSSFQQAQPEVRNRVLFIAAATLPHSASEETLLLHSRAVKAVQDGFNVHVVTLLPFPWNAGTNLVSPVESIDGVLYECLPAPAQMPTGADELRRLNGLLVADRAIWLRPAQLMTDGTVASQAVAAAVGRTMGVRVDFAQGNISAGATHQRRRTHRRLTSRLPAAPLKSGGSVRRR